MSDYSLEPGEFAIMQTDEASLNDEEYAEDLDELILSNRNIIMVASKSVGIFKRASKTYKLPLERIACPDGTPQVMVLKKDDFYCVQVVFEAETISFEFDEDHKYTAERWADGIRRAAVGDLAGIRTEDSPLPKGLLDLANGAKQVFGGAFAAGAAVSGATRPDRGIPSQTQGKRPAAVTSKCSGCHAPLSGRKGSVVTCEYCGRKQAL